MRPWLWLAAAALVIGGGRQAAPPARTLHELLARSGRYVVDYGEKLSLLVGVEHYTQLMRTADAADPVRRVLESEFALFRVADDWLGFRDVYTVDGLSVGDCRDRVLTLLSGRSDEGLAQGRRIADESARYNLGAVQRNFNTPTMALFFLHPKNQARFRYTKSGEETFGGTRVWVLTYRETQRPTIVRTTEGRDVPVSGTFRIDPADGRVLETRLDLRAEIPLPADATRVLTTAAITVRYAPDERFGLLLPAEMRESYEGAPVRRAAGRDVPSTITCVATYSDFKAFETSGKLIVR